MSKIARHPGGFSLMEVLLLVMILGIVGVAAGSSLQTIAKSPTRTDQNFQGEEALVSKLEAIRALGFSSIAVGSPNTTLSDSVTIGGVTYARTVTVALADGDGDGNADSTFKQVTVACNGQTISTLISQ